MNRLRSLALLIAPLALALVCAASAADAPRRAPQVTGVADPTVSRDDVEGQIITGSGVSVGYVGSSPKSSSPDDVTLNFPNVDVHEVAKALLDSLLGLNYAVDQAVSGTVTVVTAKPVPKRQVLPIFESALKVANMALVREGDVYVIVPLAAARRQPQIASRSDPGYGTEAIPLRFVNATELKKLLDPLVPQGAIAQIDTGRNLLLVTGTGTERAQVRDLVRQFDVNWMRGTSFALFVPKNTDSRSLAAELDAMINAPGSPAASVVRILSLERLNAVLAISAEPQYLREIKKWVGILDRLGGLGERKLFVYRVQNGRAADLAKSLAVAFGSSNASPAQAAGAQAAPALPGSGLSGPASEQPSFDNTPDPTLAGAQSVVVAQAVSIGSRDSAVTISSDETNNAILVYATARQYAVVQDALAKLDILPLQVMIEASIIEVTLNDNLRYGVQWFFQTGGSQGALSEGKTSTPVQDFPGFSYVFKQGSSINATLNALSDVTTIRVVSAPKLMVLNNRTASLQVGDQVPVATQSSVSTDNPSAPIVNSIEYRDTGVILKVTPRVNDSGLVLLDIGQEVSDVSTTATSKIDSPTIQQRRIASSVAVKDGQTVALGGLIRDNDTRGKNGLPFLSQVPVLGALFGSTDNQIKRTELLVMLTPRVVRNPEDAESVTEELSRKLKEVRPLLDRAN